MPVAQLRSDSMARAYHSWEKPPVHGWEQDDNLAPDEDSDSDPEDRGLHDAAFAADMFVDYILALYFDGKLSGKAVCVLCFWAHLAGAKAEAISQFSLRPSSSSGHFQRKIDSVLGTTTSRSTPCSRCRVTPNTTCPEQLLKFRSYHHMRR